MVDRSDRGQVILVGAIALAFIIMGAVVVFNGVLHTSTLSSGETGASAATVGVAEREVDRGIGCLLERINTESSNETHLRQYAEDNISTFGTAYGNTTVESTPAAVTVTEQDTAVNATTSNITHSNVTITYDTHDISYEGSRTIEAGCR
jgi:hypothetical protein